MFARPRGAGSSALAFAQGLQNGLTFGLGNRGYALVRGAYDALQDGTSLSDAYDRHLKAAQQLDAEDAELYPISSTGGEFLGSVVPLVPGGIVAKLGKFALKAKRLDMARKFIENSVKIVPRIKQVTPLSGREKGAIGFLGGMGGIGSQAYSDVVNGHLSSFGDYEGAAAGGALQAVAAIHGRPGRTAFAGGATTSMAQDLFNGRGIDFAKAAKLGAVSGVAGATGGVLGHTRANNPERWMAVRAANAGTLDNFEKLTKGKIRQLANKEKEMMGEALSSIRTRLSGDKTASTHKQRVPLNQHGYTLPDQVTALGRLVESKMGNFARLSASQLRGFAQLGSKYRVDHFLPRDIGAGFAFLAGQGAYHAADDFNRWLNR